MQQTKLASLVNFRAHYKIVWLYFDFTFTLWKREGDLMWNVESMGPRCYVTRSASRTTAVLCGRRRRSGGNQLPRQKTIPDRRTDRSPPKSTHTLSLYVSASAVSLPYDNGGRSDSRWTGKKLGFWVFVDEDTIFQISLSRRDVSGHPQSSLHWYSHKRSKDFILKGVRWTDPARFMGTSFWKLKHNAKC